MTGLFARSPRRAVLVGVAVVVSACGVDPESGARRISDPPVDIAPNVAVEEPERDAARGALYFVQDDSLVPVDVLLDRPVRVPNVVDSLLQGPDASRPALRSALPDADVVRSAAVRAGIASVDLAPEFADIPSADQVLAVGQIVMTLTALPGVGQVTFTLDGESIDVPKPDGSLGDGPVARDDYEELTPSR